ncbi:hypothetical protein [Streptomyces sp. NPDC093990]
MNGPILLGVAPLTTLSFVMAAVAFACVGPALVRRGACWTRAA